MSIKPNKEFLEAMSKDPGNWRGIFYINRKDRRLIVPKFNAALGWTLNFANPVAWIFIVLVILIIIGSEFLFK